MQTNIPEFLRDKQYVVVAGAQKGDEGKGKITFFLSQYFGITGRFGGGSGTGATVFYNKEKYKFRLIPVSVLLSEKEAATAGDGIRYHLMGGNELIDLSVLHKEYFNLKSQGFLQNEEKNKLILDSKCSIVNPWDICLDAIREYSRYLENGGKIGSTRTGMGPGMEARIRRKNLITVNSLKSSDLSDLLEASSEEPIVIINYYLTKINSKLTGSEEFNLRSFVNYLKEDSKNLIDLTPYLGGDHEFSFKNTKDEYLRLYSDLEHLTGNTREIVKLAGQDGDQILAEGTQSAILDPNHGVLPFTSISNTTGTGVAYNARFPRIDLTVNVVKAIVSRVGSGPFVTKITDRERYSLLSERAQEFGTTTGRPRDLGDLDLLELEHSINANGGIESVIALTKLDVFSDINIRVVPFYKYDNGIDLPETLNVFPEDNEILSKCTPGDYEDFDPIEDITKLNNLHRLRGDSKRLKDYLENKLDRDIVMIGNGPDLKNILL